MVVLQYDDDTLRHGLYVQFGAVMGRVHCEAAAPAPNLIFQLVGNPRGTNEMKWQEVSGGRKTLYAFHGSRLDNFHSILHYGLHKHFSKVSICPTLGLAKLRNMQQEN
jgi:poly[ADP-ribose] polymerase 16